MKVVIAIDSFKGSMSSYDAGKSAENGVKRVVPNADVSVFSVADGGEGTANAIISSLDAVRVSCEVHGPLMDPVTAEYGIFGDTAIMEMACASGITLIPRCKLNPLCTTTFGVGEMIKDAVHRGCRKFIIGIGGSSTNDGGIGMLAALGAKFSDENGKDISPNPVGLRELKKIDLKNMMPELKECSFTVACDVKNPLCGENGCSAVFGPQKGADPDTVKELDFLMSSFSELTKTVISESDDKYPGTGAAGGIGFAFKNYLGAELLPGIDIILKTIKIEEKIKTSDLVITGEGRLDGQTVMGKTPVGIAALAKKHGKKCIAVSGCIGDNAEKCNKYGIDAFFPILRNIVTLDEALNRENAMRNMEDTVEQIIRLIL